MTTMGAHPSAVSLPSHLPMYPRLLNRGRGGREEFDREATERDYCACPFSRSQVSQSSNLKKRLGKASCLPTHTFTHASHTLHTFTLHTFTHSPHLLSTHSHTHPTHSTHSLFTHSHTPHTGFWEYSDSEGSDLDLPAVTPLNNEDKDDFDFYG